MQPRKILIAALLVVVVSLAIAFLLTQQYGGIIPQPLQASDFLGQWYNINPNPPTINVAISFSTLLIQQNQGTYTLAVVEPCYGCYPFFNFQWSTVITINPPNAHGFYSFESGGSVDLQLKLLNATSMQVKESFQEAPSLQYGAPTSSYVQTEQFAKVPINYATTSSSATTQLVSTTVTLPESAEGSCGVSFKAGFNATAGQILTGSVSASTVVGIYVMTPEADQAWVYQFKWAGGSCTPSNVVASLQGSTSYGINVRIPSNGNYELIIVNPSQTSITAQIILNLIPGTSGYSQTVQSQQYVTMTPSTSITASVTTSTFSQVTSSNAGSEKLILDNYNWDMSKNSIWVRFGNVGTVPIDLPQSTVYLNGILAPAPSTACGTLNPGWNCGYGFTPPTGNWVAGKTYTLTVETPDALTFSFPIIAGGSG
jgi:hypothetical protein